jgi:hypothetical protein
MLAKNNKKKKKKKKKRTQQRTPTKRESGRAGYRQKKLQT